MSEAVAWKRDQDRARRARSPMTFRDAADRWREDAVAGVALARGRRPFRLSTLSDYLRILDGVVLPELGGTRLDQLTREQLNGFAASLSRKGLAASTVRNTLMPVRAVCRHGVQMGWLGVNPTVGMIVPAGAGRRMNVIAPTDVDGYLLALPDKDRPLWATALFAGLRRGELMHLAWPDVDLEAGLIRVHGTKSHAAERRVPVSGRLRHWLEQHRAREDSWLGLVFARGSLAGRCKPGSEAKPFNPATVGKRARKAFDEWKLKPVTLHDCRHTFASLAIAGMAARGVFNPKLLQSVMGHSSLQVSYDRYGHLFPGQEMEIAGALDELLDSSDRAARVQRQEPEALLDGRDR